MAVGALEKAGVDLCGLDHRYRGSWWRDAGQAVGLVHFAVAARGRPDRASRNAFGAIGRTTGASTFGGWALRMLMELARGPQAAAKPRREAAKPGCARGWRERRAAAPSAKTAATGLGSRATRDASALAPLRRTGPRLALVRSMRRQKFAPSSARIPMRLDSCWCRRGRSHIGVRSHLQPSSGR